MSSAERFDIYKPVNVLWLGYMEEVVCDRDDLLLNPLFNFEPIKGLEYRDFWQTGWALWVWW